MGVGRWICCGRRLNREQGEAGEMRRGAAVVNHSMTLGGGPDYWNMKFCGTGHVRTNTTTD